MSRVIIPFALIVSLFAGSAAALEPINADRKGLALEGYDPVAYFELAEPTPGVAAISHEWNGATWRFATREHRVLFAAAPETYAPKYGGYCAWAVSQNSTADIDPSAWKIVDGALYLNYSAKIQKKWAKDIPGHIAAADRNWPGLLRD